MDTDLQQENPNEKLLKQISKLLESRGRQTFEMAKKAALEENIDSPRARKALEYFINEYWHDTGRPTLVSLICEAVGGDPTTTPPIAIPLMLIGGAVDIHDDIIDQSKTKNDRPTLYGKFGKNIALLIGDALLVKGFILLGKACREYHVRRAMDILNIVKTSFFELGDAEAMELPLFQHIDISPREYLRVVEKKAADVEAYAQIAAILGGGTAEEVESFKRYGRLLGMLAILRDDVMDAMNVDDLKQRLMKESPPIPVLHAIERPEARSAIESILGKGELTPRDVEQIIAITRQAAGFIRSEELLRSLIAEGLEVLEVAKTNQEDLAMLLRLMSTY